MTAPIYDKCDYPRCNADADYGNMDVCADDSCEELIGIELCRIHANAILNYNDDKDQYEWGQLSITEKSRVNQIVYRLKHGK